MTTASTTSSPSEAAADRAAAAAAAAAPAAARRWPEEAAGHQPTLARQIPVGAARHAAAAAAARARSSPERVWCGVVRGASSARGSVDDSSSDTTQSPTPQGVIDICTTSAHLHATSELRVYKLIDTYRNLDKSIDNLSYLVDGSSLLHGLRRRGSYRVSEERKDYLG